MFSLVYLIEELRFRKDITTLSLTPYTPYGKYTLYTLYKV